MDANVLPCLRDLLMLTCGSTLQGASVSSTCTSTSCTLVSLASINRNTAQEISKEVCWTLSNIAASSVPQVGKVMYNTCAYKGY